MIRQTVLSFLFHFFFFGYITSKLTILACTFSFHNRMQLLVNDDSTTLSYWLNWRVFLCAIWVLTPMVVASFLIWKYEYSGSLKTEGGRTEEENSSILHHRSWKPCLKEIHPVFLLVFRITAFCLLLVALSVDIAIHGFELFYYYTQ